MKLICIKEVKEKVGVSHNWIYQQIKKGDFPAPRKLGANMSRWVESEIDEWITNRPVTTHAA